MSTAYQILCKKSMEDGIDHERKSRFYMKRNIREFPQYDSNYKVFQNSMYSRLKGKVVVRVIYVWIIFYFKLDILNDLMSLRLELPETIKDGY